MSFFSSPRRVARWGRAFLVLAGVLLLSGCTAGFWHLSGHQSTIEVAGPVAQDQLDIFYVTCWVVLGIFIIVGGVLAYATVKFRTRKGHENDAALPVQSHGNPMVEFSLIVASCLCLAIIAVPTIKGISYTYAPPAAERADALQVTATGHQWWFQFEYTDLNNQEGRPLLTANELVIPTGRPVVIQVRSIDVIHSFWVPKLAGKVDMIPNRPNHLWLQANEPGYYYGQCAEFCGTDHALMRFRVIALSPDDFAAWLAREKKPAYNAGPGLAAPTGAEAPAVQLASYKTNQFGFSAEKWPVHATAGAMLDNWREQQLPVAHENTALIAQGRKLFSEKTCVGCHTIRGHEGMGITGPDLTHVGSRTTIAGGILANTPGEMARWISHPDQVKPDNIMYRNGYVPNDIHLTPADVQALVAYLESLK